MTVFFHRAMASTLGGIALLVGVLGADTVVAEALPQPAKLSAADQAGALFERLGTQPTATPYGEVMDATSLLSSDKRFASGLYQAGPSRIEITEPYGVDEFMLFLEGGVRLTSTDGTVTDVIAGEAVTIPKEWTGIWETDGYRKIWVIYSADGEGL